VEFVRHRTFSFAQESTRYCNYSKDKFGNELTFIIPKWVNIEEGTYNTAAAPLNILNVKDTLWYESCYLSEFYYKKLLELQSTPQEARAVLTNSLKTELVMTGYLEDWKHFFDLRLFGTTGKPHPDAQYAAALAYNKFVNNNILPSEEQTQLFCDKIISKNE
jgi:thymidylate synthase (FAD)